MTGPSLDLDALREKAEKATPGPWRVAPGTLTRVDGRRAFVASTFFSVGALDQLYANAAYVAAVSPDVILAVLALVEEQRECIDKLNGAVERDDALIEEQRQENERLREALTYVGEFARAHHHQQPAHVLLHSLTIDIPELVERALACPPAANEITSAPWRGLEGWNVGVEFRGDDVVVMARAPGQSVWRDLLTVTR